jgi:hypothetical protein
MMSCDAQVNAMLHFHFLFCFANDSYLRHSSRAQYVLVRRGPRDVSFHAATVGLLK